MQVEKSELIFEKIDKYFNKDLIKLNDNTLDEYSDDNGNQIQEKEIKMLIPVNLNFNHNELKLFINDKENQLNLLDFFKNEFISFKYSEQPIFDLKIGKHNFHISCKYENVITKFELLKERKEKAFDEYYMHI